LQICARQSMMEGTDGKKTIRINDLAATIYLRTKGSWVRILPAAPIKSTGYVSKDRRPFAFLGDFWGTLGD